MTVFEAKEKLLARIGLYRGFLYQTISHFNSVERSEKDFSRRINLPDFERPILMGRLLYRNAITMKHEFSYAHNVTDKNLEETLKQLKGSYSNFTIAQCYEAFETFLKDVIAASVYHRRILLTAENISITSFEECRNSIRRYCSTNNKYNKRLFKLLYQLNPQIEMWEEKNNLDFGFQKWNVVFSEIRHSIVHSNSIFDLGKSIAWDDFQRRLLFELFLGEQEQDQAIISTLKDYQYIIEIIAQHGQLITDLLLQINKIDE